jgi:hypothetical protein
VQDKIILLKIEQIFNSNYLQILQVLKKMIKRLKKAIKNTKLD